MRKQDRVAQQQQSRPPQEPDRHAPPGSSQHEPEKVKGSASPQQPPRVPRPGGRLPLPD